ncbi:MAG: MFS transporter [Thaumarchaeota archaeon]|nr:MFS transporter [Nitrososphaerota archaeon]
MTRGIVILTVVTAVRSISATGISFWLPTYISTQKGAGIGTLLGLTLGVMYATAIIGQLFFGVLVDRFDKRLVLGIGSAGSALSTLGYIFSAGTIEFLFIGLFGLFTFSIFPTLLALASEYVPDTSASLANSLVWGLGITGGSVIGPLVVGVIVGNNLPDLNIAFELMAVTGMIGALATPLMPKPVRAERPVLLS